MNFENTPTKATLSQLPNNLESAFDPEKFRTLGHELIDMLADQIGSLKNGRSEKVLDYKDPEEQLNFWKDDFKTKGEMPDFFQKVLQNSISVHHPKYIGHQVAAPALVGSLAGLVSDLLSNGTGVYEMGMASNAMERIICDQLAKQIGFSEEGGGFLTSGGTLANLTALLAARKAKAPSAVWEEGHQEKLAVMVSEEAHYCIDRAARIMDLGAEGIIKVPVDDQFRLKTDLLLEYYEAAQEKGYHVIAIIACAGSTATGSYDDLIPLSEFAKEKDLWLHVDGAHGGCVVFSDRYENLVNRIELADSVVIDFHKMLLTPALNTALIFKEGHKAYQTFAQRAQYLWDSQQSQEWYNSGKRTFECTKFMMALKVYSIFKAHGFESFQQNVDRLYDLAKYFANEINHRAKFELLIEPSSNIVNFRIKAETDIDQNKLNESIRKEMMESGSFYIVQTMIKDQRYLRTAIMNPLTGPKELTELLDEIERLASKIQEAMHK